MATTTSPLLRYLPLPRAHASKPVPQLHLPGRRLCLLMLTASTATLTASKDFPALAEDIPLFGLRKSLKKVEKEAEEILREGEQAVEKGLESVEVGLETTEKGVETAEKEIESVASFVIGGDLTQAGIVAGAEVLGVVVASSVVNGIVGSER